MTPTIYSPSNFEIIALNEDVNEGVNEGLSNNKQVVLKVIAGNPAFLLKKSPKELEFRYPL